jgi:hypothetical protein
VCCFGCFVHDSSSYQTEVRHQSDAFLQGRPLLMMIVGNLEIIRILHGTTIPHQQPLLRAGTVGLGLSKLKVRSSGRWRKSCDRNGEETGRRLGRRRQVFTSYYVNRNSSQSKSFFLKLICSALLPFRSRSSGGVRRFSQLSQSSYWPPFQQRFQPSYPPASRSRVKQQFWRANPLVALSSPLLP